MINSNEGSLPTPEGRPGMSLERGFFKAGIPVTESNEDPPLQGDVAALAVIIGAFAHGLRPDLDPAYLFHYTLSLVEEMTNGLEGISNVDAENLGRLLSDGAKPAGKTDVRH